MNILFYFLGGAQIIDLMILVIDASKGVQTQTAECMVIAEITAKKLMVVINKTDLLKNEVRSLLVYVDVGPAFKSWSRIVRENFLR